MRQTFDVGDTEGVKYCLYYEQLIKGYVCQRCRKKLKIHCNGCTAMYVEGVERSSKYTVRAVMLSICFFNFILSEFNAVSVAGPQVDLCWSQVVTYSED